MSFTITIPIWLLWTLGILGGLCVLGLCILGVYFIVFMSNLDGIGKYM